LFLLLGFGHILSFPLAGTFNKEHFVPVLFNSKAFPAVSVVIINAWEIMIFPRAGKVIKEIESIKIK